MQTVFILCALLCLFLNSGARLTHATEVVAGESFSAQDLSIIKTLGPWPATVPPDAGNELSGRKWAEVLGEQLFNDPDLSGARSMACATCHQADKGFADSLNVAVGERRHVRNTQGLWNVGLQRWFGWDGGSDSLWAASLRPILSDIEMAGEIDVLARRFREKGYVSAALDANLNIDVAAASDEQFVVLIAKAVAAYMRTLVSLPAPFDRFRSALLAGDEVAVRSYSESARRGLKIFVGEANCHVCHFGPNFSNGEFHDTGRPFFTAVGQVDSGRYGGIKRVRDDKYNLAGVFNGVGNSPQILKTESVNLVQSNFGQWRTPSLRNLTLTAPYMHDGSLATLRDAVDAYADIDPDRLHSKGEAILKPLDMDDSARNDLVEFLKTL